MATLKVDVELRRGLRGMLPAPVIAQFSADTGLLRIAGPSGSGKSTLLAAIAGVVPVYRGRIAHDSAIWNDAEQRVARKPEARRVGWVPQGSALFPHLTVKENIRYGSSAKDDACNRLARALEIDHLLSRSARTLSGGEASRAALARALATEPRILLLDEPFAALDRDLRERVTAELLREVERLACIALLVEHGDEGTASQGQARQTYMMHAAS